MSRLLSFQSPRTAPARGARIASRPAFTLIELLVVIAIIAVLVGLVLAGVQSVREAGRRISCGNNLKQLSLAFSTYEQTRRQYPLAISATSAAQKAHNWAPFILPFIEETTFIAGYQMNTDWWRSPNREIVARPLKIVQCPSTPTYDRIQDKPESDGVNKTGSCGDYFTPTGVNATTANAFLPPDQQMSGDSRGLICWFNATASASNGPETFTNEARHAVDGLSNTICSARVPVVRMCGAVGQSTRPTTPAPGRWA